MKNNNNSVESQQQQQQQQQNVEEELVVNNNNKSSSSNSIIPIATSTEDSGNSNTNSSSSKVTAASTKRKTKSDTKQNRIGEIKVTRNIRALRVDKRNEPINFPESGILYEFNVKDWENKMAFYDQIAYSFGVPSTQKTVFCSYLNCHVMHYERTCQGVYYCPHIATTAFNSSGSSNSDGSTSSSGGGTDPAICTVKPCRYRFQQCEHHKTSLKKSDERCKLKLHFYVPKEPTNHLRLLLCIGDHNHPLIPETFQPQQQQQLLSSSDQDSTAPVSNSYSADNNTPLTPMSASSDSGGSPVELLNTPTRSKITRSPMNKGTVVGYPGTHINRNHSSNQMVVDSSPPQYSLHPPQYYSGYQNYPAQQEQRSFYTSSAAPQNPLSYHYSHPGIPTNLYEVTATNQFRQNNIMPVPAYQTAASYNMQQHYPDHQQTLANAQKKRIFTLMNTSSSSSGSGIQEDDIFRPAKRSVPNDDTRVQSVSNVLPSISTFFVPDQQQLQQPQIYQVQQQPVASAADNQVYYSTRTQTVHQQLSVNPPAYYQVAPPQQKTQGPPVYQAPPPYFQ